MRTKTTAELFFTILHTNDEHSALLPAPFVDYHPTEENTTTGGIARLASMVKELRSAKAAVNEPLLLISSGDFMGGSPFSWLAFRDKAAELSLMIEIGYDLLTLGNHELDFNPQTLARYLKGAGYPEADQKTAIVVSNMKAPPGHPLNDRGITDTYIRVLDNGLKLGFFGLIGKDAILVSPLKEPLEFIDQAEAAGAAVKKLQRQSVDLIIAISHSGVKEEQALVKEVAGIDIIIGGHCHTALQEPVIEGETIIVQAGELYKYLGVLELAYNPTTGKVRVRNTENGQPILAAIDSTIPIDPAIDRSLSFFTKELGKLAAEQTGGLIKDIADMVAVSDFDLPNGIGRETPMGNFITDAIRLEGGKALGKKIDLAFFASGPIRSSANTGKMPYSRGQIKFYDLADTVSLGSGLDDNPGFPIVSAYFTKKEIRKIAEISLFLTQYMSDHYFIVASGLRLFYDFKRAVLRLPLINQLVPTTKGALSIDLYAGEGIQTGKDQEPYIPLDKHNQKLYHVAFDYGVGTAIPIVGERVFYLTLQPKDQHGNPLSLDDAIIYRDGKELKVWQAVVEYAATQPRDKNGFPRIPESYRDTTGRFVEVKGPPLYLWPLIILLVLTGGLLALLF